MIREDDVFNPDMLSLAMDSRMVDAFELVQTIGDYQVKAYLSGEKQPDIQIVERIGKVLNYPPEFFYRAGRRMPKVVCYRHGNYDNEDDSDTPEQLSFW